MAFGLKKEMSESGYCIYGYIYQQFCSYILPCDMYSITVYVCLLTRKPVNLFYICIRLYLTMWHVLYYSLCLSFDQGARQLVLHLYQTKSVITMMLHSKYNNRNCCFNELKYMFPLHLAPWTLILVIQF
jgi:hypothetical protein